MAPKLLPAACGQNWENLVANEEPFQVADVAEQPLDFAIERRSPMIWTWRYVLILLQPISFEITFF